MTELIDELLESIPTSVRDQSGTAFDSGLNTWSGARPLYLLGYNPGGQPDKQTVYGNASHLLREGRPFSNFVDSPWIVRGHAYARGEAPMQRRVRHLLDRVGHDPREVPTSNIIYARSGQAADLDATQARDWAEECWPFHARMIERLGVQVVACFGGDAGRFVRNKLGANTLVGTFVEQYGSRTRVSRAYVGNGPAVVSLSHPARANWTSPRADPSELVVRALAAN